MHHSCKILTPANVKLSPLRKQAQESLFCHCEACKGSPCHCEHRKAMRGNLILTASHPGSSQLLFSLRFYRRFYQSRIPHKYYRQRFDSPFPSHSGQLSPFFFNFSLKNGIILLLLNRCSEDLSGRSNVIKKTNSAKFCEGLSVHTERTM